MMFVACSHNVVPVKENMLKNKSFVHLYFQTLEECIEAQPEPDFFMNCHQQVDFYAGKKVEIMLSDIYYRGTYKITGNLVVLTFEPNHEIPDGEIVFQLLNPAKLLLLDEGTVWKKMSGNDIWK